jgi:hypothetical protein
MWTLDKHTLACMRNINATTQFTDCVNSWTADNDTNKPFVPIKINMHVAKINTTMPSDEYFQ